MECEYTVLSVGNHQQPRKIKITLCVAGISVARVAFECILDTYDQFYQPVHCPSWQNGGAFQVAVHTNFGICGHHIDLVYSQRVEHGPDEEKGHGRRCNGDCAEYGGQSQCMTCVFFWCSVL